MPDPQTGRSEESLAIAGKPKGRFCSRAAWFSLIAPSVSWLFLLALDAMRADLFKAGMILTALFLISIISFAAGFAGLFAARKSEVVAAIAGIIVSAAFGLCDLFVIGMSGMGHNC